MDTGIRVTAAQLRKAADLIEAAERGEVNGQSFERPSWLYPTLVGRRVALRIGILPQAEHIINDWGEEIKDSSS